jgi:hypothetical protein
MKLSLQNSRQNSVVPLLHNLFIESNIDEQIKKRTSYYIQECYISKQAKNRMSVDKSTVLFHLWIEQCLKGEFKS